MNREVRGTIKLVKKIRRCCVGYERKSARDALLCALLQLEIRDDNPDYCQAMRHLRARFNGMIPDYENRGKKWWALYIEVLNGSKRGIEAALFAPGFAEAIPNYKLPAESTATVLQQLNYDMSAKQVQELLDREERLAKVTPFPRQ
jgi:hypothetical protein